VTPPTYGTWVNWKEIKELSLRTTWNCLLVTILCLHQELLTPVSLVNLAVISWLRLIVYDTGTLRKGTMRPVSGVFTAVDAVGVDPK
jgi:hypothetical protein